jgi:hypothetical protein
VVYGYNTGFPTRGFSVTFLVRPVCENISSHGLKLSPLIKLLEYEEHQAPLPHICVVERTLVKSQVPSANITLIINLSLEVSESSLWVFSPQKWFICLA